MGRESNRNSGSAAGTEPKLKPGDEAAPGTPGSGEDICPECGGTGQAQGEPCLRCLGTGIVQEGIGGG